MSKIKNLTNLDKRRLLITDALPEVRKLVAKYDLPAVQAAIKMMYDERKAEKDLRDAEAKVAALKNKLRK